MKDMEYEEKTAQKDYAELMADSQTTRAGDTKALTGKQTTKAETEDALMTAKETRSATATDLKQVRLSSRICMLHATSSCRILICVKKHAPMRLKGSRMQKLCSLVPASASE